MNESYLSLARQGLWHNNPALVQLLGLCPLLGVSNSAVNALGLGLATILVMTGASLAVSLVRHVTPQAIRLPAFVLLIASLTTAMELLMQAFAYELYQILGLFIPLITTNCVILGRAESFAARNPPLRAAVDGLMMGLGFALALLVLGALRELLGTGQVFANLSLILGAAAPEPLVVFPQSSGFLLAILPPGAFLILGLLIAAKNAIDQRIAAATSLSPSAEESAP